MDMKLNQDDVQLLIDALDDWSKSPSRQGMVGDMIGALLTSGCGDESKAKWEEHQKAESKKRENEERGRKNRATMLKAKLVMLQGEMDSSDADKVLADAKS